MDPVTFTITTAGLDALVNAQNASTDPIQITAVGITPNGFTVAPTITAVPGEIKRISAVAGQSVSETVIHMTAQDVSTDMYDVRGMGLYLSNGVLFAVYSQPTPLFRKVSVSFFLLALDIGFTNGVAGSIHFGDTTFLMPPATETIKGVAEIATRAETRDGTDDSRIVSPLKLKQAMDDLGQVVAPGSSGLSAAFTDLVTRTITGSGLVKGGGSLETDRILSVDAASAADVAAGTATDKAITPAALSGLEQSLVRNGHALLPGLGGLRLVWGRFTAIANGTTHVDFPREFPTECFVVLLEGLTPGSTDAQDNNAGVNYASITKSGFSAFNAAGSNDACGYIALGI